MDKWRGITTNAKPENEVIAKTIKNRLGQKSISLRRIDDEKRWAGFPGLAGTARKIALIIPKSKLYVEPFAGTAKVYQELFKINKTNNVILNDKSKFIVKWLKKEFGNDTNVINEDFVDVIKEYDSKDTFFLIDPPWYKTYYDQPFSHFDRDKVKIYDEEILNTLSEVKGKFIITSRKENKRYLNSGYNTTLIKSEYVVCGKYPKVLITTNLEKY